MPHPGKYTAAESQERLFQAVYKVYDDSKNEGDDFDEMVEQRKSILNQNKGKVTFQTGPAYLYLAREFSQSYLSWRRLLLNTGQLKNERPVAAFRL